MNQEELLKSLMELDFIAVDLGLFLNTHPDDSDAIAAYNQVITAADTVRMKYEETFGPLCSFLYGDNVFEKCGINRDGAGEVGKPRYFNGKRHF